MPSWTDVAGVAPPDTIDVDDKFADGGMQYHDIEFEEKLTDLGATDGPPEIVDVDQDSFDVGDTADLPDEIAPVDLPEVAAGVPWRCTGVESSMRMPRWCGKSVTFNGVHGALIPARKFRTLMTTPGRSWAWKTIQRGKRSGIGSTLWPVEL